MSQEPGLRSTEQEERAVAEPVPGRHVLIVEDDEDLSELLALWIRGHYGEATSVHVASSVDEGTERLSSLPRLDFALLDRRFPQGSGDALLETVSVRFDAIVVMITGVTPEEGIIRLPITDYLVKPIDQERLIKRLALLEKLKASGVLTEYTDARKASLLEYHLEEPDEHPLFRRFAARWSYDRLEVADAGEETYVYELYLGRNGQDEDGRVSVSVVGSLAGDLADLVSAGELSPVGELVPSGPRHAWIDANRDDFIEPPPDGYVIYEFTGDGPEQLVTLGASEESRTLERILERTYG